MFPSPKEASLWQLRKGTGVDFKMIYLQWEIALYKNKQKTQQPYIIALCHVF